MSQQDRHNKYVVKHTSSSFQAHPNLLIHVIISVSVGSNFTIPKMSIHSAKGNCMNMEKLMLNVGEGGRSLIMFNFSSPQTFHCLPTPNL